MAPGEIAASFVALTFLEIVLGLDNIVFMALAVNRLVAERRELGRGLGMVLAMAMRIALLVIVVLLTGLDARLFAIGGHVFSLKDLVLGAGGLFLLTSGATEIHDTIEKAPEEADRAGPPAGLIAVLVQIAVINIVFSFDSVMTAIGMTGNLAVMIAAIVASTLVMLFATKPVGAFIRRRPTTKMLALSFILLVGVALLADGLGFHFPRGYLYFAIAFSLFVEFLNAAYHRRRGRA
ncbi:MAG TPA: TerC family protein [Caulobacteraceae bacterium]|nr:TerC family protein [Caulobacteraceae bacterium]